MARNFADPDSALTEIAVAGPVDLAMFSASNPYPSIMAQASSQTLNQEQRRHLLRTMLESRGRFRKLERARNVHAGPHQIAQTRLQEQIIVRLFDDVIDA